MIVNLNSLEDPRLDAYVRLTEVQLRNRLEPEKGIFIAESEKVIVRALDAGYTPQSLLIPEHRLERSAALVARIEALGAGQTPIFVAPSEEIEKLTGFELTRGVLCAMGRKPLEPVERLLENATRVAVLEDITNHTNVGAIFRNAAALGFDAVLITPGCCDPLYRRAIRVSMGTVFQVPWTRIGSSVSQWREEGVQELECLGFTTVAMALHSESIFLDDERLQQCEKLALLLGTEGAGLCESTIENASYVAKIPMKPGVDSLNVAAASAVAFWQLRARH